MNPPAGCRFHTRCGFAQARCREEAPASAPIGPAHEAACHFAGTIPALIRFGGGERHPRLQARLALHEQKRAAMIAAGTTAA